MSWKLDDRGQMGACKDPLLPITLLALVAAASALAQVVVALL